jgi:hypothetical protein
MHNVLQFQTGHDSSTQTLPLAHLLGPRLLHRCSCLPSLLLRYCLLRFGQRHRDLHAETISSRAAIYHHVPLNLQIPWTAQFHRGLEAVEDFIGTI